MPKKAPHASLPPCLNNFSIKRIDWLNTYKKTDSTRSICARNYTWADIESDYINERYDIKPRANENSFVFAFYCLDDLIFDSTMEVFKWNGVCRVQPISPDITSTDYTPDKHTNRWAHNQLDRQGLYNAILPNMHFVQQKREAYQPKQKPKPPKVIIKWS